MAKPRILSPCNAERATRRQNERIAEFSSEHGGGLFSIRTYEGHAIAELYRLDETVRVRVEPDRLDLGAADLAKLKARLYPEQENDALDAARWRALFAGGRIRIMGWAGFDGEKPLPVGCHLGVELWDRHPSADPSSSYHGNNGTEREFAAKLLTSYADSVIATKAGAKAEDGTNGD
jgi:hypothetical protein